MSIVHSKISGLPNVDVDHVGGADWDDQHLHGPGAIFLYGMARIESDPVFGVDAAYAWCTGGITSVEYNDIDYKLKFVIDQDNVPVVPGATVEYFIDATKESAAWCPESLTYTGINSSGMTFEIRPLMGTNAPFSEQLVLLAKLYVIVTAP